MDSKTNKTNVTRFAWKQVKPSAFECDYYAAKLHIEQAGGKWTFWVRTPRGLVSDGVRYDSHQDAADAAENSAIESFSIHGTWTA